MELAKSQCQGTGASAGGSSAGGAKRRAEGHDGGHSTWRAKAARHEEPAAEERATSDPYGDYDDYDEPGPVVASKPRAEKGGGSEDYWGSGASRRGGRRGGGGKRAHQRLGPATASALDDQLASYFK
ncbi:unnamed protein product [Prorocentrum cordatum]|uniref:Chromatin target of PRMT1 protein C-terminal domain-containing protein n=1 Tax=Prorocentrum cordatum TaxID=2364126 RepID=A0ABN9R9E5_9DINO|nr:unnamed protein product [Polarella glacialis]